MKPYITHNNILVTGSTLEYFKEVVFSIPYNGVPSQRRPFYRNIAVFLQHVICVSTCSRKNKKKAKIKANKKWSCSVPVPFELGREKLPGVFKKSGPTHERAIEALASVGIIKLTGYSSVQHSCREYAVSQRFLRKLFGTDREAYLCRKDRYHYLTDIFTKRKSYSFDELIGVAIDRGQNAKHQQSKRDIPNTAFRELVVSVWDNLEPLEINLDALLAYHRKHPTKKNKIFIFNFLSRLAETGVDLVKESPLTVSYRQSYKTAFIGGRSFEAGTGFQSLPSKMKWACLARGVNYDIKGCQLEILRHELLSIGISAKSLEVLETQYICWVLRVAEELVKQFRFSSVFNAGFVTLSLKSSTRRLLNRELGEQKAKRALKRWKRLLKPLRDDLELLLDSYEAKAKTNRYGKCVTNAVGQTFNITYKDITARKRWKSDVMRRKLLSHMLQGLESRAVYDYVTSHKGVCALEHDGFVSYEEITDWSHPYLLIEQKH
ncbi:TPA: hypothetical protein ACG31R_004665 [Escherichia coli]|uniref:hypothetical protein n=1 Tax=Escherichia coli TaxID=562 RepID=UPI0003B9F6FC|nr:hypothetical protein [Escherichia coli]ESA27679.1 hypothetical protein L912_2074 [Escherichia coli SCD1]MDZ6434099.1 hypothetical protein [Escherichia coli]HAN8005602.1 hypothetical protein [Escherichia coli]HAY4584720.1 hypothetical protein [Escherichia coli]HAY5017999.1 hypothetical protein [Escherichia coli]